MLDFGKAGNPHRCSFCGKSEQQVHQMIAGPGVYICDECVDRCNEIIAKAEEEEKAKQ